MNCTTMERYVLLESAGELSAGRAIELHSHLDQCASCRAYARDFATIIYAFPSGQLDAPTAVVTQVLANAARSPIPSAPAFHRLPRIIIAVAASLVICLGFWATLHSVPGKNQASLSPSISRISDISDIIYAVTDPDVWFEQWGDRQSSVVDVDELARQILVTQGLYVDLPEELEEDTSSLEEHQSTTLLWRNTHEPLAETCG